MKSDVGQGAAGNANNNATINKPKKEKGGKKRRTAKDKKERIWGKAPQKPYISSSLGDMCRVMMRYACMENTYFYNNEPPPVEFYDFWQKFSVDPTTFPPDFVDTKKTSIANMKKNTSSFDFFAQYTAPVNSKVDLEDAGAAAPRQKKKSAHENLSDIWKDVRISMSTESFISSSTKISESGSAVPMETGWDEACSEDYQSSESDYGLDVHDKNRHHRHRQLYHAAGGDSAAHQQDENKNSSLEFHTPQGLIDKQANAITQSILALQKKDNRILYELATKPRDLDIIDHFADDLDDSFLVDSYSYSELPDEAFGPDFDFFNEDLIYKKKGKKGKRAAKDRRASGKGAEEIEEFEEDDDDDVKEGSSDSECPDDLDLECVMAKSKKKEGKKQRAAGKQDDEDDTAPEAGGYAACLERRRKRIEDKLRAAARKRSPMGSYRPGKGEEPFTKIIGTPGPAAYNPQLSGVKPNIHTAFLSPRWSKSQYNTLGPGPAAYMSRLPDCPCEMLNLHEAPRFQEEETLGPGPANVNLSNYAATAKDKPKAIIFGRRDRRKFTVSPQFTNCTGLTRFGRANPPKALIIGRNGERPKSTPGPGEYDPKDLLDTKLGIVLKSRLPPNDSENTPGYYELPDLIGTAPGFSFGIKNFMEMKDQSPGPIYQIYKPRPPPVSLTFRPFDGRGKAAEPSPLEWGMKPGEGKNKVLPKAPVALIHGSHDPGLGSFKTPAPNHYDVCDSCILCAEPGVSFKGKPSSTIKESPGPGHYDPVPVRKRAPYPVFQNRHKEKDKNQKGPLPPGVDDLPKNRVKGGIIAPRWREKEEDEEVSPELLNIFGMTNKGPKKSIPISLKSRHTPFKYSHIETPKDIQFDTGKNGVCSTQG